jgi:hypothetical protein
VWNPVWVHDTIERPWRRLEFFQYRCELVAKVPRVNYEPPKSCMPKS